MSLFKITNLNLKPTLTERYITSYPYFSPADRRSIFNKFKRGAASGREKKPKIGLNYVKIMAEAYHGTVNLHSKKGEGILFELFFPLSHKQQ